MNTDEVGGVLMLSYGFEKATLPPCKSIVIKVMSPAWKYNVSIEQLCRIQCQLLVLLPVKLFFPKGLRPAFRGVHLTRKEFIKRDHFRLIPPLYSSWHLAFYIRQI